jgi:hypothetical protein
MIRTSNARVVSECPVCGCMIAPPALVVSFGPGKAWIHAGCVHIIKDLLR